MKTVTRKIAMIAAASGAVLAVPAMAQGSLAMLDTLADGMWELRYRDGAPSRRMCIQTGREFLRLRHPEGKCNRFVVEDARQTVTVQYTCQGDGYGRTSIRKEDKDLVQIDSQGIKDGRPFQFTAEARRVGSCRR